MDAKIVVARESEAGKVAGEHKKCGLRGHRQGISMRGRIWQQETLQTLLSLLYMRRPTLKILKLYFKREQSGFLR